MADQNLTWDNSTTNASLRKTGDLFTTPNSYSVNQLFDTESANQDFQKPGSKFITALEETHEPILDTVDSITDIATVAENWSNEQEAQAALKALDAAGSAAVDLVYRKLKRLKDMWDTPVDVSLKSIADEIAPYAVAINSREDSDIPDPWTVIKGKLSGIVAQLLGVSTGVDGSWASLWESLGEEAISEILGDEQMWDSLSDLQTVQITVSTIDTVVSTIEYTQKLVTTVEPIIPIIEILSALFDAWKNPASGQEALNQSATEAQRLQTVLMTKALEVFKKWVFKIKIRLPSLLVTPLKEISIRDSYSLDTLNKYNPEDSTLAALGKTLISDQYASNVENGNKDLLESTKTKTGDKFRNYKEWSDKNILAYINPNSIPRGSSRLAISTSAVARRSLQRMSEQARRKARAVTVAAEDEVSANQAIKDLLVFKDQMHEIMDDTYKEYNNYYIPDQTSTTSNLVKLLNKNGVTKDDLNESTIQSMSKLS